MDNGTMVESFKFLNYYQLAKNSLASKRFRDVIQTHRHKLALLNVKSIYMQDNYGLHRPAFRIFDKDLSPEEYNAWIVSNGYSKLIPLECQVAGMENTEDDPKFYELTVSFDLEQRMNAFYAYAELNHEKWPLFQHFIRLLTDPFIYIKLMDLTARNHILYLLTEAMNPDHNRLQCANLSCHLEGNVPKFISWIKDHVRCDRLAVLGCSDSNKLIYDRELLHLFMTGADCSSRVVVGWRDSFPKIVDDFVQKFRDLKDCDEYQIVKSIEFSVNRSIEELKKKYAEFSVKEKPSSDSITKYIFEFVNGNIGKKLQLTMEDNNYYHLSCCVSNSLMDIEDS